MIDTTQLKIEKGIPFVSGLKGVRGKWSMLLKQMQVGDSFFISGESMEGNVTGTRIAVHHAARYHKMRASTRSVEGGMRVWRIE